MDVKVYRSSFIGQLCTVCGWLYFSSWFLTAYPQIFLNYKRKSVVGLSFDYVALNILGHSSYAVFNNGLYFIQSIKEEYWSRYPGTPIPVLTNDLCFSIHGTFATTILVFQCFIYKKADQKISYYGKTILIVIALMAVSLIILIGVDVLHWLDFLYFFSYIKLLVTVVKYVPQAYTNFKRKSTVGWSIIRVMLDLLGGTFSLLQMFLISYNYDDWNAVLENPTKFGVGFLSFSFNILFIFQHCVLFKDNNRIELDIETTISKT